MTQIEELEILKKTFAELYDYASENLIIVIPAKSEEDKHSNIYADLFWQDLENAKKHLNKILEAKGL